MPRSWEENRYQGGLGDLADDEDAFNDEGTVDLGHGTVGGEFNVDDHGHTISDDEVANNDDVQRTGNDTVTHDRPDGAAVAQEQLRQLRNDDQMMLLALGAAGMLAVYLGVRD